MIGWKRGHRGPGRLLAIGAAAALVAFGATACTNFTDVEHPALLNVRAPAIDGWLHTKGTEILDEHGDPVRLLGVNMHGMQPGYGVPVERTPQKSGCYGWAVPPPSEYDNIEAWGFNSVRLPISWANLEPQPPAVLPDGTRIHHYNDEYLGALDGIVGELRSRGIATVISMQQNKWTPAFQRKTDEGFPAPCPGSGMPVWLYQGTGITTIKDAKTAFFTNVNHTLDDFAAAWQEVAKRYADDPTVVGFDLLNEPYSVASLTPQKMDLDGFYRQVGSAIRKVNEKALLIFEDTQDQLNGVFSLTGPPPFDDEVYSFHLYRPSWEPLGRQVVEDFTSRADAWNVPVWVGEFNCFGGTVNDVQPPYWQEPTEAMLSYFKAHRISWAVYAYSGASSLLDPKTGEPKTEVIRTLQEGF